jgi:glutamyl-tRNA reductase
VIEMSPAAERNSKESLDSAMDVEASEHAVPEREASNGAADPTCDLCMNDQVEAALMGLASLRLVSVNHRRVSFTDLDRFALGPDQATALHERLRGRGVSSIVLSTCNRTELYWQSRGNGDDVAVEACFQTSTGLSSHAELIQREDGEAAARHLFRVASGLDSLLVGESEILGQVNDALGRYGDDGFMSGVFRAAVRCGRYGRSETEIGTGALSIASAAVRRLAASLDDFGSVTVAVVGAGSTGVKVARHLRKRGVGGLVLINRTIERAQSAAPSVNAEVAPLDDLPVWLAQADAVAVASHAPAPLISAAMVRDALGRRAGRPLVLLDLSMPRGVDPEVASLDSVTVHDLSNLEALVSENLDRRRLEIPKVEAVVERELEILKAWARHEIVRPILAELRVRAEQIRRAELDRLAHEPTIDCDMVDRLTRRLIERLLSIPATIAREDRHPVLESCGFRCLGMMGETRDESA